MIQSDAKDLLREHKLKATQSRISVLSLFLEVDRGLSSPEIEQALEQESIDRVTIYRTLDSFEQAGIIHKIPSEDHFQLFALTLNHIHCTQTHAHFHCEKCDQTICMPISNKKLLYSELPSHFTAQQATVLFNGVCAECNHLS
jgi:Fur family ferric uptake transcriptional regulator